MKLDAETVLRLTAHVSPSAWIRIMKREYAATPLGTGYSSSRFSAKDQSFKVLYAAADLPTALAEAVIRDRFQAAAEREIEREELDSWAAAEVRASRTLRLVDLRGRGAFLLGIDTDAVGAREHEQGQLFATALHGGFDADGILYSSRLTAVDCMAVFDRAVGKLKASEAVDLTRIGMLTASLDELRVILR